MVKISIVSCLVAGALSPVLADNSEPLGFLDGLADRSVAPAPPVIGETHRHGPITMGALTWFDSQDAFEAAAGEQICVEDLEESNLSPGRITIMGDILKSGEPCTGDGCPFPNGLEGCDEMTIQSNTLGGEPVDPSPAGGFVLDVLSVGFAGVTSDVIIIDRFPMSFDVLIGRDDVVAMGATPVTLQGGPNVDIRVYDVDNNFLGMKRVPANPQGSRFFGVISDGAAIGRVNAFDPVGGNNGAEGLDNIRIHSAGGGSTCNYKLKKVKARRCQSCPKKGSIHETEADCSEIGDCKKKIKTTIKCPEKGKKCKLKGKRNACE